MLPLFLNKLWYHINFQGNSKICWTNVMKIAIEQYTLLDETFELERLNKRLSDRKAVDRLERPVDWRFLYREVEVAGL